MSEGASALARGILAGDRRVLARAITLVESRRPDDERQALALLRELLPDHRRGLRLGVSGSPGVGKSSLLEKLGLLLIQRGSRPAVLAIDPTSQRGGGSVLGDKTRMVELSRHPSAYVRPSPSGAEGGGVARTTGDVLMLCEAAGFSPCLVETVGVGQAETAVTSVVDLLLVLLEPGAGDELSGIKRGLNEWGDVLAVNKADGVREDLARTTAAEFGVALSVLRPFAEPPLVLPISTQTGLGIEPLWQAIEARHEQLIHTGELEERRFAQRRSELSRRLSSALMQQFLADPARAHRLAEITPRVATGELLIADAIAELLSNQPRAGSADAAR